MEDLARSIVDLLHDSRCALITNTQVMVDDDDVITSRELTVHFKTKRLTLVQNVCYDGILERQTLFTFDNYKTALEVLARWNPSGDLKLFDKSHILIATYRNRETSLLSKTLRSIIA